MLVDFWFDKSTKGKNELSDIWSFCDTQFRGVDMYQLIGLDLSIQFNVHSSNIKD